MPQLFFAHVMAFQNILNCAQKHLSNEMKVFLTLDPTQEEEFFTLIAGHYLCGVSKPLTAVAANQGNLNIWHQAAAT